MCRIVRQMLANALLILIFAAIFTPAALADTTATYDFSGILTTPYSGNDVVTGQFVFNTTNSTIYNFDFSTPVVEMDPTHGWKGDVVINTPAFNPAQDFVRLYFHNGFDYMNLVFETDLSPFAGNTFYTDVVYVMPSAYTRSTIECQGITCAIVEGPPAHEYESFFVSGSATFAGSGTTPPVSEPCTFCLLATGFLASSNIRISGFGTRCKSRRRVTL